MFIIAPHYNADPGAGQKVNANDMWLTVDENGEYVIHFWENGKLKEEVVEKNMISTMEAEMEVREE